jgi:hypothetical protein
VVGGGGVKEEHPRSPMVKNLVSVLVPLLGCPGKEEEETTQPNPGVCKWTQV